MGLTETEDIKGGGGSPAGPGHLPQAQGCALFNKTSEEELGSPAKEMVKPSHTHPQCSPCHCCGTDTPPGSSASPVEKSQMVSYKCHSSGVFESPFPHPKGFQHHPTCPGQICRTDLRCGPSAALAPKHCPELPIQGSMGLPSAVGKDIGVSPVTKHSDQMGSAALGQGV